MSWLPFHLEQQIKVLSFLIKVLIKTAPFPSPFTELLQRVLLALNV